MVRTLPATLARLVVVASSLAALILVAYILLVIFKANPGNDIVRYVGDVARPLAWTFKGLFTPRTLRVRVTVNFGLAAVVYLVVGRVIARLLRIGSTA
jgi:hypothetical protein